MVKVNFSRKKKFRGGPISFDVFLDGQHLGLFGGKGGLASVELEPGKHTVKCIGSSNVPAKWRDSEVTFEVPDNVQEINVDLKVNSDLFGYKMKIGDITPA